MKPGYIFTVVNRSQIPMFPHIVASIWIHVKNIKSGVVCMPKGSLHNHAKSSTASSCSSIAFPSPMTWCVFVVGVCVCVCVCVCITGVGEGEITARCNHTYYWILSHVVCGECVETMWFSNHPWCITQMNHKGECAVQTICTKSLDIFCGWGILVRGARCMSQPYWVTHTLHLTWCNLIGIPINSFMYSVGLCCWNVL